MAVVEAGSGEDAAAAASRVNSSDGFQCRLDSLLAQQLAERIEDDAIADTEEEMEGSGHDALRMDGEERRVSAIEGMLVCWSAVARGGEETALTHDADRARVSGRRRHEAEHRVDEAPVAVEEGGASVNEMLQHSPDVREGSRFAHEPRQALRTAVLQL